MTNLTVDVYRSTVLSVPTADWLLLARVSNTNAYTAPAVLPAAFFMAIVVEQFMTLAWDYPSELVSPSLFFNLYWRPDASAPWQLTTSIPGSSRAAGITAGSNSGHFMLTASDPVNGTESEFSNIVSYTNSVGQQLRLQIKRP